MADAFAGRADQVSAPATGARAITPHDSLPLSDVPKALYVGSGGTITMRGLADGSDSVWRNIASGSIIPFRAVVVRATGTTASDLLALY